MTPTERPSGKGAQEANAAVVRALRQRGLEIAEAAAEDRTLLPCLRSRGDRDLFYQELHSYAFRLFLRDILALRDRYLPERLGPFFTADSVEAMASLSERLGLIRRGRGGTIRLLAAHVTDFGETFEWYLAQVLRREFSSDALWGVTIPGLSCGGDFDVLAIVSGKLLCVEAKTSPPKHIERKEISAFLARVRKLSPDVAVLLVDTHLRMKDKLVPMLSEGLRAEGIDAAGIERVERETFSWGGRLFLTNSKRDVAGNLSLCLRSYFLDRFFG